MSKTTNSVTGNSNMTYKEYSGRRVTSMYGNINGNGLKIPVTERDVIEASMVSSGIVANPAELLSSPYHDMTCQELKALVG
jgi:hypothetical protein